MHAVMASRRRDLERLRAWQANTATTPGFLDVGSAAIWDTLLAFQSRSGIAGDIAEIGVLHGKSAVLAALHTRPEERLVLCDLSFAEEVRQLLRSVKAEGVEYLAGSSGHLVGLPAFQQYARRCRWIHIDGDHSGQGISQDLALADQWLADAGVISCDDFMNPAYPQVTAAIFHYLDRHRYELSMFLCGYNKCYLARPKVTHSYLTMIARDFYRELAAWGTFPCTRPPTPAT
jgi:predicted O-methyltransferase YrrM